jgi:hypothetical protein
MGNDRIIDWIQRKLSDRCIACKCGSQRRLPSCAIGAFSSGAEI